MKLDRSRSCWVWTGWIDKDGYGRFTFGRSSRVAHRLAYEWTKGPVSPELTIDHLCRNRACCNPDHLQAVTRGENVMRGVGAAAMNARKTTCKRGHPFDGIKGQGKRVQRYCKTCKSASDKASYKHKRT